MNMTSEEYNLPFQFVAAERGMGRTNLSGVPLAVCHLGAEGQTAYVVYVNIRHRVYVVEFVQYLNNTWAYHVEDRNERFITDSRLGASYYPSFYQAKQQVLKKIAEHYWNGKL
jgi:hypothetical protein